MVIFTARQNLANLNEVKMNLIVKFANLAGKSYKIDIKTKWTGWRSSMRPVRHFMTILWSISQEKNESLQLTIASYYLPIVPTTTMKHNFIPFYVWSPDWKMLQNVVVRDIPVRNRPTLVDNYEQFEHYVLFRTTKQKQPFLQQTNKQTNKHKYILVYKPEKKHWLFGCSKNRIYNYILWIKLLTIFL